MQPRVKLSDKVIASIREDIASGKLKKGEKIPAEPELMELYGVGRSTIREAIKTLAIAGTLKVQQGSGTFVTSLPRNETLSQRLRRAEFQEINSVRLMLEKEIIRLACQNYTSADLEQIRLHLQERGLAIQNQQQQKCADADIAFHISIAKASGNKVLTDLYQSFTLVIRDFFSKRKEENMKHFENSHPMHQKLAAAIAARDQKMAEEVTQYILENNY
ncbi:FadR/GntR family transcriptional regulator [Pedobacter antarcticus]|uniref:Transcriptional regulator n=2 Tax=Pedobacter antarcticus TaxID=34086 RepID=A0A081PJ94_9SPHI|nr:FadR/GntR family transcriptional regulator [Pedobacter antarcticus]KEQ30767.1 transcriptional regulator [Pedobacter antarcticus 4BY]SDM42642.1 transcriptional regulator, GntR family [Pedobacter antarcticus]SFE92138.1 DNA-binding transcriptional regulator, FadR family [Pedobacter antarcticus]